MNAQVNSSSFSYSMAEPGDLAGIRALLSQYELPHEDVDPHLLNMIVAKKDAHLVGTAAVELHGTAALLRSVCVAQRCRSLGVATHLCDLVSAHAQSLGATHLYLLTTTAARFFEARGFSHCARDSVPADIRATTEFLGLCPASAACLVLQMSSTPRRDRRVEELK